MPYIILYLHPIHFIMILVRIYLNYLALFVIKALKPGGCIYI